MRLISFWLTRRQFLDGSKKVTRRHGWGCIVGDEWHDLMAVEKGQGLKLGEKVKRLGQIKARGRWERLDAITRAEVALEGFPGKSPGWFIKFFCRSHKGVKPETVINRIEFEKVKDVKKTTKTRCGHAPSKC